MAQTTLESGSGLSHTRYRQQQAELRQGVDPWSLRRIATAVATCFTDITVCRTAHTWVQVTNFRGLIFRKMLKYLLYSMTFVNKVDMIMWPMHDDQIVVAMVTR